MGTFFVALLSEDPLNATAERERERSQGRLFRFHVKAHKEPEHQVLHIPTTRASAAGLAQAAAQERKGDAAQRIAASARNLSKQLGMFVIRVPAPVATTADRPGRI